MSAQRERIVEALAQLSAEQGFAAATIQAIVSKARTSKRVFYANFKNKEAARSAAVEEFIADAHDAMGQATAGTAWPAAAGAAAVALLKVIADRPGLAKLVFLEPPTQGGGAGPPSGERTLAPLFEQAEGEVPPAAARAARAGAIALIVDQLIADRAARLPELLPEVVYIVLVPYLGQEEAVRQSQLAEKSP